MLFRSQFGVNLNDKVPAAELYTRLEKFRSLMSEQQPNWQFAIITNKVSMYYFTGTIQEGIYVIRPQDDILWVRRSYERAMSESEVHDIRQIKSFREIAAFYGTNVGDLYLETKKTTLDWLTLFGKYFNFDKTIGIDSVLSQLRMIKSDYELNLMQTSGMIHERILDKIAPTFLKAGMSETELAVMLYSEMLKLGAHGVSRFNLPMGEEIIGLASFGSGALLQTAFDGPGGTRGTCNAVQAIGSSMRRLQSGYLVYLDIPCGVNEIGGAHV